MTNVVLAILLMLFVLILGPTVYIMDSFTTTIGSYVQNLPSMSFSTNTFSGDREWLESWTIFYWAWWIAWSAFVGTFIARVSRGRTIREFLIGVLAVPTISADFGSPYLVQPLSSLMERTAGDYTTSW